MAATICVPPQKLFLVKPLYAALVFWVIGKTFRPCRGTASATGFVRLRPRTLRFPHQNLSFRENKLRTLGWNGSPRPSTKHNSILALLAVPAGSRPLFCTPIAFGAFLRLAKISFHSVFLMRFLPAALAWKSATVAVASAVFISWLMRVRGRRIPSTWTEVGEVSLLYIYPLKSGKAFSCSRLNCTYSGVALGEVGDRSVSARAGASKKASDARRFLAGCSS